MKIRTVKYAYQSYAGAFDGGLTLSTWGWPQVGAAYGLSFVTAR
ncbi:Nucleoid-associated protein YbaB [Vibrio chagasii]|uniref:Nucleoid-associated protein YbaB n=1 Tax=Vibrio coralliirubri TaxID=1516159 RepID=A0AA86XSZ1_9VIBR